MSESHLYILVILFCFLGWLLADKLKLWELWKFKPTTKINVSAEMAKCFKKVDKLYVRNFEDSP